MRRRVEKLMYLKEKRAEAKENKRYLSMLYYTIQIKLWKKYAK